MKSKKVEIIFPVLSVVICTYNRADDLKELLDSLAQQQPPSEPCEVIVVDNASTDRTCEVTSEFTAPAWLTVRYIYEGIAGLSKARNTGIEAARGEIVAFLDDDLIADPMLLRSHLELYRLEPEACCAGGKSLALWLVAKPEWFAPRFNMMLGCGSFGDEPRVLTYPEKPLGCNMSIRKNVLTEIGGFSEELGRIGKSLLSNEECLLFHQIAEKGYKIFSAPAAIIHHKVYPYRATRNYLLRRMYWQGISDVLTNQLIEPSERRFHIHKGVRLLMRLALSLMAVVRHQIQRNPQKVMSALGSAFYLMGTLQEELTLALKKAAVLGEKTDGFPK